MRHEIEIYEAMFSELTDDEFVRVIGQELQRRGDIGICLTAKSGVITSSVFYPNSWVGLYEDRLENQLRFIAAYVSIAEPVRNDLIPPPPSPDDYSA